MLNLVMTVKSTIICSIYWPTLHGMNVYHAVNGLHGPNNRPARVAHVAPRARKHWRSEAELSGSKCGCHSLTVVNSQSIFKREWLPSVLILL